MPSTRHTLTTDTPCADQTGTGERESSLELVSVSPDADRCGWCVRRLRRERSSTWTDNAIPTSTQSEVPL